MPFLFRCEGFPPHRLRKGPRPAFSLIGKGLLLARLVDVLLTIFSFRMEPFQFVARTKVTPVELRGRRAS